jgi:hypothetical protein
VNRRSDHLDPVRSKLRAAPIAQPPHPWRSLPTYAVGGLQFVGFDRAGRYLLIVSSTGRGLFDCETGEKVAREYDGHGTWLDEAQLECTGIGPIAGQTVRLAGIGGGGLSRGGADGWSLETVALDWPDELVVLLPSFRSLYEPDAPFTVIARESELRAVGFAPSGRTLVVATSSDFCWWSL